MRITLRMKMMLAAVLLAALLPSAVPGGDAAPDAAPGPPTGEVATFAEAYGLERSDIASFDAGLSARLLRFGQVAQARGRHVEAKRFFWKAILVDPTSTLAWKCYDQAVLFTLADRVERSPGLVGLPGLADEPQTAPAAAEPEPEEGC